MVRGVYDQCSDGSTGGDVSRMGGHNGGDDDWYTVLVNAYEVYDRSGVDGNRVVMVVGEKDGRLEIMVVMVVRAVEMMNVCILSI